MGPLIYRQWRGHELGFNRKCSNDLIILYFVEFGKRDLISATRGNRMDSGRWMLFIIVDQLFSLFIYSSSILYRHVAIEWDVMTDRPQEVKKYCDDPIRLSC